MTENVFAHQVVRASAGSGKTYKLSERYLRLLLVGVPVDAILATTFTRKAAGEIQSRIFERLGKGALSPEGAANLSRELFGDPTRVSQERLRALTVEATRSFDRMRVCTLDAFFIRAAGSFEFELGLPPGWTIGDELDEANLMRRAIQTTFAQAPSFAAHRLAQALFKGESKRNVETQIRQLVSSALEIYREAPDKAWRKVEENTPKCRPLNDCLAALAAAELPRKKSAQNIPLSAVDDPKAIYLSRFVDARDKLYAALVDPRPKWKDVLSGGLVAKVVDGSNAFYGVEIEGDLLDALQDVVDYVNAQRFGEIANYLRALRFTLDAISTAYDRFKRESGLFRFDDLAQILAKFASDDMLRRVAYRLDAKTTHLLLDEFQDSSPKQWSIVAPFARSITSRVSDDLDLSRPDDVAKLTSFFCVGDAKQAIYGWRGGVAEIFDLIEKTLPNLSTLEMATNWRSCPVIIETVNRLFESIESNPVWPSFADSNVDSTKARAARDAAKKWNAAFAEHRVAPKNLHKKGFWSLEVAPRPDEPQDDPSLAVEKFVPVDRFANQTEPDPRLLKAIRARGACDDPSLQLDDDAPRAEDAREHENPADDAEERAAGRQKATTLAYAVERIVQLAERYPDYSIGVLTRTRNALAQIARALKARGIEASAEGGAPIVDEPAPLVALALFRLAAHPGDSVAAFQIANVPTLAERFHLTQTNCREVARALSSYLRERVETLGVGKFAAEARDVLKPLCDDPRNAERLDKFVEFAFSFEAKFPNAPLDRFVNAALEETRESPSASNIRVMTIHGAKGLEFDIVVLPELDATPSRDLARIDFDSLCVGRKSPLDPIETVLCYVGKETRAAMTPELQNVFFDEMRKRIEEALCLLYVAVTRPVRALVAIVAPLPPQKEEKADGGARNADPTKVLSFANILRNALAPGVEKNDPEDAFYKHAQIVYQDGTPDWDRDDAHAQPARERDDFDDDKPLPFVRVDDKRLLLQRRTPTGDRVSIGLIPSAAFERGSALHACFEQVRWLDADGVPSDEILETVARPLLHDRGDARKIVAEFKAICNSPFARRLLSLDALKRPDHELDRKFGAVPPAVSLERFPALRDPNWQVFRERPFSYLADDGKLARGVIDRLVLLRDGERVVAADVVDFKTDRGDEARILAERLDEYRRQLAVYVDVVRRWHNLPDENVSARLAFASFERLVDAKAAAIKTLF